MCFSSDANECADSTGNDCSSNAQCTNTEGSYECACLDGFLDESPSSSAGRVCTSTSIEVLIPLLSFLFSLFTYFLSFIILHLSYLAVLHINIVIAPPSLPWIINGKGVQRIVHGFPPYKCHCLLKPVAAPDDPLSHLSFSFI